MQGERNNSAQDVVQQFIEHLLAEGASASTIRNYRVDVLDAITWLSRRHAWPFDGTPAHRARMHYYRSRLAQSSKPATANRRLSAFRSFLSWAASKRLIEPDVPNLKSVSLMPKQPADEFNQEQRDRLIQVADEQPDVQGRLIFHLLLDCGIGVEELCSLRWSDVIASEGRTSIRIRQRQRKPSANAKRLQTHLRDLGIHLESSRAQSLREVQLPDELAKLLEQLPGPEKHGRSNIVFRRTEGPLTRRAVEVWIRRVAKIANVRATARMLLHAYWQTIANNPFKSLLQFEEPLDKSRVIPCTIAGAERPRPRPSQNDVALKFADTYQDLVSPAFLKGMVENKFLNLSERSDTAQDIDIRLAVRERATGRCERCEYTPGRPELLEVHHIISAGEEIDRLTNCVALCANCHREAHLVECAQVIEAELLKIVGRFGPDGVFPETRRRGGNRDPGDRS
jgi:site-specific recombinase XerD